MIQLILMILLLLLLIIILSQFTIGKESFFLNKKKKANYFQKIPFIFMQTYETKVVSRLPYNPEYDYLYFDHAKRVQYLQKHFDPHVLQSYHQIIPGAYKADLFRYCFLYKQGGIYCDVNKSLQKPFRDFIHPDADLGLILNSNHTKEEPPKIANMFLFCKPKHPLLFQVMNKTIQNIQKKIYGHSCLSITGPYVLGEAFFNIYQLRMDSLGPGIHRVKDEIIQIFLFDERRYVMNHMNEIIIKCPQRKKDFIKKSYAALWKQKKVYVE